MKVLTVVGARPQFIKAAPLSKALKRIGHQEILIHTGQHYDSSMSQVFFDELGIPTPDVNLDVGSGSHAEQTAAMLRGLEATLNKYKPDWVLIYGDTNSTLAGALTAAKLHVPVAHIEAGLRSFNRRMPEEINRIVADVLSSILFAPTKIAASNLFQEGIPQDRVHIVGDIMYDAAREHAQQAQQKSKVLTTLGLRPKNYVLATIHRAENTDDVERLRVIFNALCAVSVESAIVLPLHPRTRAALERHDLLKMAHRYLQIIEPVGYLDMIMLEQNASLIVTDSGGVQKEAFFYHVPCVTLRYETEWLELIDLGWNRLCPPLSEENIVEAIHTMAGVEGRVGNPYGDGDTAWRIAQTLTDA